MSKFIFVGLTFLMLSSIIMSSAEESSSLSLSNPINVTVLLGKDVVLPCVVDELEDAQITWQKVDNLDILSVHDKILTKNRRITKPLIDERSTNLTIRGVQDEDRGWYGCRMSPHQQFYRQVYLEVLVPPTIVESSSDMVVNVGSNVTLICKAIGHPTPEIMWWREDLEDSFYKYENDLPQDEVITLYNISLKHKGSYRCTASNDVPFAAIKIIKIDVKNFVVNSSHQLHSSLTMLIVIILVIKT